MLIPVNEHVEDLAREAKQSGREVYLATASDELLASRIAGRFDFLDGVIASDGNTNLKGARKATEARRRFPDGFDYVGDANLDQWSQAVRRVIERYREAKILVAGHGKPGGVELLSNTMELLEQAR